MKNIVTKWLSKAEENFENAQAMEAKRRDRHRLLAFGWKNLFCGAKRQLLIYPRYLPKRELISISYCFSLISSSFLSKIVVSCLLLCFFLIREEIKNILFNIKILFVNLYYFVLK